MGPRLRKPFGVWSPLSLPCCCTQPGELKSKVPPHLLHPKVLLFNANDGGAELWVGSHNWTARALTGVNIEGSLVIRLQRDAELYVRVAEFLDDVRHRCQAFDAAATDYYKWLQGLDADETF